VIPSPPGAVGAADVPAAAEQRTRAAPSEASPLALEPNSERALDGTGATPQSPPLRDAVERGSGDPIAPPRALPGYAGRARPRATDSRATTAFVLGLIGLVVCQVTSPFAWYIGHRAREAARLRREAPDSLATAGWVMGMIGTGLVVLGMVVFAAVMLLAASN
jgi:hypothetical protein